jgi:integrase/recombinase XerD
MRQQMESFLSYLGADDKHTENTLVAYRNDLSQFIETLEGRVPPPADWAEINRDIITSYLNQLQERGYASSTVARKVAALKSFFHYLKELGFISENPAFKLESPKVKKQVPRTLSSEDIERLLAAPAKESGPKAQRDTALMELLYATGMRVTELVMLKLGDVDLAAGVVRVQRGRGGKERVIPIRERAISAVRDYLAQGRAALVKPGDDTLALFLNHRGQQLTRQGTWLIIKEYAQAAGVQVTVTPHVLRHSFAAHMLENQKASLTDVQRYLGHANIATTQVYAHIGSGQKRRAYEEPPRPKELVPQPA